MAAYQEYAEQVGQGWEQYRADLADVADRASSSLVLVAVLQGALVGSVSYYPPELSADETQRYWPAGLAYFRALSVDPQRRRSGIGAMLTQACIARARADGATGVALNTTSVMPAAQAMYERMGFVREGEPRRWPGGLTLLRYVLRLASPGA